MNAMIQSSQVRNKAIAQQTLTNVNQPLPTLTSITPSDVELYGIDLSLRDKTGRGKVNIDGEPSNIYKLLYRMASIILSNNLTAHKRNLPYKLKARDECFFLGVTEKTLYTWLMLLVSNGLAAKRFNGKGLDITITPKGHAFILFLRGGEPLCITNNKLDVKKCGDAAITDLITEQAYPIPYTDHPNPPRNKNISLRDDTIVDNSTEEGKKPVTETPHVQEFVNRVQAKQEAEGLPRIRRPNIDSFVSVLEKEGISTDTFMFACQAYLSSSSQFVIHSPLGFVLDQCVKDRNIQREVYPEDIDNQACELSYQLLVGMGVTDPTIEILEITTQTLRQALLCNQYN